MGVPEGTSDYVGYLRSELADAGLVVPIITPAFFDSDVCLVELGAMWGMKLDAFPLVVPPVAFSRFEAAVGKVQGGRINDPGVLDRLRDRVVAVFELDPKTDMWTKNRETFDGRLSKLLDKLAPPQRVPASDLEKATRELAAATKRANRAHKELKETKIRLDQVAALKDPEEVAEIVAPADEQERLEAAAAAAREAMDPLPTVVCRALYENYGRGEALYVEQWDSDAAENARRRDLLQFDSDSSGYWYNEEDPSIEEALAALAGLFEYPWSDDVEEAFRVRHKKRLGRGVEPAWEALGLL